MNTKRSDIECPHYVTRPGSRTCISYVEGGGCSRPDIFMCTEWVRKNSARAQPTPPTASASPSSPAPASRDLFGGVVSTSARLGSDASAARKALPLASTGPSAQPFTRPITEEQIKALEERSVELCVRTEAASELWLVPRYTGADRNEMTYRDAATIAAMCAVFPGAEVTRFERLGRRELDR